MATTSSTIKPPFSASKAPDAAVVSQVCGWADEGEIELAGKEVERQLRAGRYCVEIFKVWLTFRFAGRGLGELPHLLRDLDAQVRADDLDRAAERGAWERALAWLATSLRERVKFHAKSRDATWQRWCQQLDQALDAAFREALAALQVSASERAESRTKAALRTFGEEIELLYSRTFGQLVDQLAVVAGEQEPADGEEVESADGEPSLSETAEPNSDQQVFLPQARDPVQVEDFHGLSSRIQPPNPQQGPRSEQLFRSLPLEALRAKLVAFERLAADGTWSLAAMVARDVEQELSQFDPIRYLPDLFSGYLRTLSEVGAELEQYMQQDGSLESQALERLYRADPGHFLSELSLRQASGA